MQIKLLKNRLTNWLAVTAGSLILSTNTGISVLGQPASVYVLLFEPNTKNEGIHTIKQGQTNTILMFSSRADAVRYASDINILTQTAKIKFPSASVESINISEMLSFCQSEHYTCKRVPEGSKISVPSEFVENTDWRPSSNNATP
ncbi:DUF3110 domain-containing protein [Nostoc sp.]|uniref:DUF3110 domain-containing protein n=1 Tax=Nostoc sp. TaxID=1180 RepID=UPI003FA5F5D8